MANVSPKKPTKSFEETLWDTLDDKIELNRRKNAKLEGMAQALFKSWFVDFDPVIDNALEVGIPIPDELSPRAEVRRQALANGTPQQGSIDHPTLSDPKSLFPAVATGRSGKLSVVSFVHQDFWPLNTTLWVKEYKRSSPYHAYFLPKTVGLERYNAGSAVATLNRNHNSNISQHLPADAVVSRFTEIAGTLFEKINRNAIEFLSLTKLRETLQPKLISGNLEIPEDTYPRNA
tara:strand:+ start:4665 stop:5363 length:699 start_codon:yes stop_codon:yes gene_type:complete